MNTNEPLTGAASQQADESATRIPCHLIIAHPEKPKFLVIRHSGDHWSPPFLKVPAQGALMYKAAEINRGMMRKYKLRTSVLRVVMEARNYAVIELELHASSQHRMQAVWMGKEEYAKFRKRGEGENDPFEQWILEKESGITPDLRAPWQIPGWYKTTESWFSRTLDNLGIQATGSVQQLKAGWPAACLLRIATTQGNIHFKAAYSKPPGEARLTKALARLWPDHVIEPLAVDEKRNWMVLRDYKLRGENRPNIENLPAFASAMGKIQVESMQHLDQWEALGCINMDLDYLRNSDGRANDLYSKILPLLTVGTNPLQDSEVAQLEEAIGKVRKLCDELDSFNIQNALAHLDYRPDNFFVENEQIKIFDWADVAVTHPFMTLCRTLDFLDRYTNDNVAFDGISQVNTETKDSMQAAYLARFSGLLPIEKLEDAFTLSRTVYTLFYFYYVAGQIQFIERGTSHGNLLHHLLCSRAKILIKLMET